jgi:hypothetical protein
MQARTKIRFDAVERARKLLEDVRPPEIEEVTKSQAIRLLLPQIREAQSKGHSIEAIARMLSESGVPVSAHLVKDLVWKVGARPESKRESVAKPARRRAPSPSDPGSPSLVEATSKEPAVHPTATKASTTATPASAPQAPSGDGASRGQSPAPSGASSQRRSTCPLVGRFIGSLTS